jgi:hypothetical protein
MSELSYSSASFTIRKDIVEAHRRAWQRLAHPGTWLTGTERVAIAAESRNAKKCLLCSYGEKEDELRHSRNEILKKLGPKELVDSAAVIATFNKMGRIADSTGIPLDGMLDVITIDIQSKIGLNRFQSAANTPKPGGLKSILSKSIMPIAPLGMKLLLALQRESESSQPEDNGE